MSFSISNATAPRFGKIYVANVGDGRLDITLTDKDRELKPFPELPDHFRLLVPGHSADEQKDAVEIRWMSPDSTLYDAERPITDRQVLKPLVEKMSQRSDSIDWTVQKALMKANGLNRILYEKADTTATEMAHYPHLSFSAAEGKQTFYAQFFERLTPTLRALNDWLTRSPQA